MFFKESKLNLLIVFMLVLMCSRSGLAQGKARVPLPGPVYTDRERPVYAILDFRPASVLISPDVEEFETYYYTGSGWEYEEVDGDASWVPSLSAGVGFNTPINYIDVTFGGGSLLNSAAPTSFAFADLSVPFKLGSKVTLGPHFRPMHFSAPEWQGDSDVEFEDTAGWGVGAKVTAGGRRVSFCASVDYWDVEFDVDDSGTWSASDSLDYSGCAVQMGLLFRF